LKLSAIRKEADQAGIAENAVIKLENCSNIAAKNVSKRRPVCDCLAEAFGKTIGHLGFRK
jgi:hypothetical protein